MVTRIVTALVAIPIGILIIALNNEVLYYVAMTAFSVIAVYEMLVTTKYLKNKFTSAVSLIFAAVTPIIFWIEPLRNNVKLIYFGFVVIMLLGMLFNHEKARFEQVALVAFVSITIPLALCSIAFIRSRFPDHAMFLIVYTMVSAWVGDAGAYFVGTFFGKHKMCPAISPKKTWEGLLGSWVLTNAAAIGLVFPMFRISVLSITQVLVLMGCTSLIFLLSVYGDLAGSLVKRSLAIKDSGSLLPGIGGIFDLIDSPSFTVPFFWFLLACIG